MIHTQTEIDNLVELAIIQRAELKKLVDSLPQLRDHLSSEIERNLEEIEPAMRTELEEWTTKQTADKAAALGVVLEAKIADLAKSLEISTQARYNAIIAQREENARIAEQAEAKIAEHAASLPNAVKDIVTAELARFPRAGEIDQLRKEFAEPRGLNPRGRWSPDETYQRLDLVTINGDSFVSNIDGNRERPSRTAGDWTLSAARGNGGGGGGVTSMTDLVAVPSNGQLLIGNGSAFVNSTLTAGTGISISNGAGSITINATDGNITLDDGTAANPALNFTNYPTTGIYSSAANAIGFATSGVARAAISSTGLAVTGTITPSGSVHAAAGTVSNPSLAFDADQDTGIFRIGANNLGITANGAKVLDVATTGLAVTGTLSVSGVATLGTGAILGTPASGTVTNLTGTASININGTVGATTANTGAFTTLSTTGAATFAGNLTVSGGTITGGASGMSLASGGTNQNITLTPSGTGVINSAFGSNLRLQTSLGTTNVGTARIGVWYSGYVSNAEYAAIEMSAAGASGGDLRFFTTQTGGSLSQKAMLSELGNLLIGTAIDSANGKLQLAAHGASTGGIGLGTTAVIYNNGSSGIIFGTNGTTTALTLDSSQNATFAGTIKYNSGTLTSGTTTTHRNVFLGPNNSTLPVWQLVQQYANGSGEFIPMSVAASGLTTIAGLDVTGSISIGNTVQIATAVASTHKVTISIGGTTYYLLATNV